MRVLPGSKQVTWSCLPFLDGVMKRFVHDASVSEFASTLKGPLVKYNMSKFVSAEVKTGNLTIKI